MHFGILRQTAGLLYKSARRITQTEAYPLEIIAFAQHYLLTFLLLLSVLVFVHEFGHFWVARRCGVKVETFSIGFGRRLFGFTDKHGTEWRFAWLPLGGYVKMFGDGDASSGTMSDAAESMSAEERKGAFFAKPVGQRAAIVAAGPAANYIFAIIVLTGLFMSYGRPYTAPEIGELADGGAAQVGGLQKGDRITGIDGHTVERFEDIQSAMALGTGEPVKIDFLRAGQPQSLQLTPQITETTDNFGNKHKLPRLGISKSGTEFKQLSPGDSVATAFSEVWRISAGSVKSLGQIIMGTRSSDELGGPLRIAKMTGDMAELGFVQVIWFAAVLSVSLGLINLFPVPVLDGGHLVYYFFEWVRGKPLSLRVQEYGLRVGLALIGMLMIFATWNDLVQLRIFTYVQKLFT